jgi:hypothetical protein
VIDVARVICRTRAFWSMPCGLEFDDRRMVAYRGEANMKVRERVINVRGTDAVSGREKRLLWDGWDMYGDELGVRVD